MGGCPQLLALGFAGLPGSISFKARDPLIISSMTCGTPCLFSSLPKISSAAPANVRDDTKSFSLKNSEIDLSNCLFAISKFVSDSVTTSTFMFCMLNARLSCRWYGAFLYYCLSDSELHKKA
jgi:hypothetical protein